MEETIPVEDEFNENDENEDISDLIDQISDIVVYSTDWTVETIISQINSSNIDINPDFQRRDAWNNIRKIKYIESLIVGFPVPQIVFAEKTRGKFIVIDGKQRLLSIMQFYGIADEKIGKKNNFKLVNCEILHDLNKVDYKELSTNPYYNQYFTQLQNQSIRCVIIKNCNNKKLLEKIFVRLNTGSVALSPHELRLALLGGPFSKFADEKSYTCNQIHKLLNVKNFDYRMRDAELITRFFAFKFCINDYSGDLSNFINDATDKYNNEWEDKKDLFEKTYENFQIGLDFIFDIFSPEPACRKFIDDHFEKRFNRAILDGFIYFLSDTDILTKCKGQEKRILEGYKKLCNNDNDYLDSVGFSTKKKSSVITRFNKTCELLESVIGEAISRPDILKQ